MERNSRCSSFVRSRMGLPPHFRLDVRQWLNDVLPHRWIGRGAHEDLIFCPWPARSPDLTPRDYFLWGYVKDKVFVPPLPASIPDLKNRITTAVETITLDMLIRAWQELDYRLDVCRVTTRRTFVGMCHKLVELLFHVY